MQALFFATENGLAVTGLSVRTWFPGTGLQKRVLHQTPIEAAAPIAPGGFIPHLEEHSYPYAGQSKDGVIPMESGRPVTRVARGRGSTQDRRYIA